VTEGAVVDDPDVEERVVDDSEVTDGADVGAV
jgi:hypothetical protein